MRYQLLGRSGLRVSRLCLGTMTFGEAWGWGAGEVECRRIYDAFRDAGGNFVDTANMYTEGQSEEMLGRFLEGHRHEVVLATKYTNARPGRDSNAGGNHRKSMMRSIEESLRRLHTDFIDLYWMHIWDQMTPVDEIMRGFDDLVRQGKILHAGVSDAPAWWVAQANTMADLRGWAPFVALQIEWSLIERSVERELVPMAQALGLTITPWSPLAGGILTGKYRRGEGTGGGTRASTSPTFETKASASTGPSAPCSRSRENLRAPPRRSHWHGSSRAPRCRSCPSSGRGHWRSSATILVLSMSG